MKDENFSAGFLFDHSPEKVFNAVNNVRGWWSTLIEGGTEKQGDTFLYRYKNFHSSTQVLTEVVKNKKVVWLVTNSQLSFLKAKQDEWTGTKISFEIKPAGDKTQLIFTHHGLTPQVECFDSCTGGRNHYLQSLVSLINTGEGRPDSEE